MTLSAQFFTLPLIMANFHRLSIISPIANILVVPLLSLILISGFIATLISLIFLPLGKILFWPCYLLMRYITSVIHILANFKWSCLEVNNINYFFIIIIYLAIFIFFKRYKRMTSP